MPMPNRLLPRRSFVNGFKRQSDFDEFFLVAGHIGSLLSVQSTSKTLRTQLVRMEGSVDRENLSVDYR
jgi:hypothetical protein